MGKLRVVRELAEFLGEQKKYWLLPLVLTLALLGLLLIIAQSSVVAPFVYTLF